jgi:thioredoxin-dependent peroxiredoxin
MNEIPTTIPDVTFKTCVGGNNVCDTVNPVTLEDITTDELFSEKKIVIFALPGAFTPTCTSQHLPGYEKLYDQFKELGIDEVVCISVNDPFVMHAWKHDLKITNVKFLADGNGEFSKQMNMLVSKENLGFGNRSWRYSAYIDNKKIEKMFVEPGICDNCPDDPFEVSGAEDMLGYLKNR